MKTAYRRGAEVCWKDGERRTLAPDQIRLKVDACGVCGTDLQINPAECGAERIMTGHEVAGTITEIGSGGAGRLQIGQRIVLDSATPCGRCDACRNTKQELCSDIQSFFFLNSFGFSPEMVAPAICAIPCDNLTPEVACLQEPLGVAIDLVRLAALESTSNVLILGQGPIGLMATALARRAGVRRLFVTELPSRTQRVALARRFGADAVIDPLASPIERHPYGCAIDRILVTAPPRTLPGAFAAAAKGAIIAFIGIEHGEGATCSFDANAFHFKKLQLRASFASPALYGPLALQHLREGVVDGAAIVTHRYPLAQLAQAIDIARRDPTAVKVVIQP